MAKDKKSFVLYCDQKGIWDKLDDAQAGKLIKHIISYVNDENPKAPDFITELAFEPIKQQLKRDLKKWEETTNKRSVAGSAGASARWQKMANDGKRINDVAKIAVNDNVTVNDNVIGKGKNYFLITPREPQSKKFRIQGADGLKEYFEMNSSVLNFPDYAERFMRDRNGKHFNDFGHMWNDFNLYVTKQYA